MSVVASQRTKHRSHTCPACGEQDVERAYRAGFFEQWILPLVGYRAYQCRNCGERFYDRPI